MAVPMSLPHSPQPRRRATKSAGLTQVASPTIKPTGNPTISLAARVAHLTDQLGGQNRLARVMGVSQAQPSSWRRGHEQPSPEMAHRLLALDYVISRLADELTDWQIEQWLTSANPHLGGARPVDVVRDSGPLAIDAAVTAVVTGAAV